MKKNYVKLKTKMLLLVVAVLLLGTTLLTYQKADNIREEYLRLVREQMGIDVGVRMNAEESESDMILRVYEAYAGVKSISDDVGFYSMLKTADGNLLAEDQNFVLVKKVENNQYADARVILLGDADVRENETVQHGFVGGFFEATEIYGTCDETYIYLDELKWKTLGEEWFSYKPEKAAGVEGTVAFEEWAGSNYFHEADTPYYYHVIPNFAFSLYGDWDLCKEKGLQVVIDEQIPKDKFLVQADLEMLRVVILNYVSNAVKYAKKEIQIDISENRKKVRFTVINDGQTIEKDKETQVWDEFYKGDKAETTQMGSSGLGLAIAKNILIMHGAQYGCKSLDGKTKFWFEMKQE